MSKLSVSNLCGIVAHHAGVDRGLVDRTARVLINAGFLPKSSGRAIEPVTAEQAARLLLAVAATDRPNDAVTEMLIRWDAPRWRNSPSVTGPDTFGETLTHAINRIIAADDGMWTHCTFYRLEIGRTLPIVEGFLGRFADDDLVTNLQRDGMKMQVSAFLRGEAIVYIGVALSGKEFRQLRDEALANRKIS